ncbi:MAG: hypothetical protein DCC67_14910 [Planctomycetota bacterium]|nr:MAG: hypothetical protein DCC67_14910 [Planctomycetota bacterium]
MGALRPYHALRAALCYAAALGGLCFGGDKPQAAWGEEGRRYATDEEVVANIDRRLRESWAAHGVKPSPAATDGEWLRRVFLDVVGRIPTVAELDELVAKKSRAKRAELVDRLLGEEYAAEYAANWATIWTNLLIGRTGGRDRQSLTSREGMFEYLESSMLGNKPYDALVRELVTATGGTRPGMDDYNGAVNFLVEKLDEGGVQAAAKTAQIFLGMSVQCTQCHNHPFNEHRQNQFWELNAFFRQARVETLEMAGDDQPRQARLVDADFAGEGKSLERDARREIFLEMRDGKLVDRDQGELYSAPIFYELRNGQLQVAYPAFVDGTRLADKFADRGPEYGNSGRLEHVHRRRELARLILDSPAVEAAAVNRLWAHFFGHGFTKPVDDMGSHNPASHPELLQELAAEFRKSGFDYKRLMRWIVLSEAYALSSKLAAGNAEDDPAQGRPPLFSRFYVRQMQPEQLYDSLLAATEADAGLKKAERDAMKRQWLAQFTVDLANDEGGEATTFNGSIPQSLMMMNGELVRRACRADGGAFLARIAGDERLSNREKIHYLYRAALARLPGRDEARVCDELLAKRYGDVAGTLQDVWWALLNSGEFILVH